MENQKHNYVVYHLHSDISSAITNIDSINKPEHYVDYAQSLGMTAMAFSEHGSVLGWKHKKDIIEKAGMKYIHACEFYLTEDDIKENKHRDNYHCVLIAKNYLRNHLTEMIGIFIICQEFPSEIYIIHQIILL